MFQQGLSGLDGASQSLDVIGNNIANASTVGFKSSTAEFADVYANSLNSVSGNTAGIGVSVGTIAQNFTQGSIQASANPLDVSINGGGFFRTVAPNGSIQYSRNGQFTVSSPNYTLTNAQGAQLTGYLANSSGQIQQSTPVPLAINQSDIPPVATTTLALQENLNSAKSTPTVSPFNPSDSNSYTFAGSATQVFDSLGNAHQMQEYYVKTASNSWDVYTTVDGNELAAQTALQTMSTDPATLAARAQYQTDLTTTPAVDPTVIQGDLAAYAAAAGAALSAAAVTANASQDQQDKLTAVYDPTTGVGTQVGTTPDKIDAALAAALGVPPTKVGTLVFDPNGALNGPASNAAMSTMPIVPPATTPPTLPLSIAVPIYPNNGSAEPLTITTSFTGSTQYANAASGAPGGTDIAAPNQNGYASGTLIGYAIGADGIVQGNYSNNLSRPLAQIVMANFADVNGLTPLGNNAWAESAKSGQPSVGVPNSGSMGALKANSTEQSNVDLTTELVNMITAQRVYQANAQTIKTEDSILQTVVNLQ